MTQDSMLWRSRFRPWLSRSWQRLWPFWRDALVFDLAYSLGLLTSWLAFGHFDRIAALPPVFVTIAGPASFVTASIYRFRKRRGGHNLRHACALCFTLIFAAFVTLHFVRYPAKRFHFMGDASAAFELEPMFPTFCERVYTFRKDPRPVVTLAREELIHLGYRLEASSSGLYAQKNYLVEYPGSQWPVEDSVTIQAGQTIGKRPGKEGYVADIDDKQNWVTVTVAQPELLPLWLRLFVP